MILIRKAKVSDANSIAKVHVESWKTTYQGVLPDDTLSKLSVENQAKLWRTSLSDPKIKILSMLQKKPTVKL